jgi:hypothetical protein
VLAPSWIFVFDVSCMVSRRRDYFWYALCNIVVPNHPGVLNVSNRQKGAKEMEIKKADQKKGKHRKMVIKQGGRTRHGKARTRSWEPPAIIKLDRCSKDNALRPKHPPAMMYFDPR